jgi:hypothetical protein
MDQGDGLNKRFLWILSLYEVKYKINIFPIQIFTSDVGEIENNCYF